MCDWNDATLSSEPDQLVCWSQQTKQTSRLTSTSASMNELENVYLRSCGCGIKSLLSHSVFTCWGLSNRVFVVKIVLIWCGKLKKYNKNIQRVRIFGSFIIILLYIMSTFIKITKQTSTSRFRSKKWVNKYINNETCLEIRIILISKYLKSSQNSNTSVSNYNVTLCVKFFLLTQNSI